MTGAFENQPHYRVMRHSIAVPRSRSCAPVDGRRQENIRPVCIPQKLAVQLQTPALKIGRSPSAPPRLPKELSSLSNVTKQILRSHSAASFKGCKLLASHNVQDTPNQDSYFSLIIHGKYRNDACVHGVFDGHGVHGHFVSSYLALSMMECFRYIIEHFMARVDDVRRERHNCRTKRFNRESLQGSMHPPSQDTTDRNKWRKLCRKLFGPKLAKVLRSDHWDDNSITDSDRFEQAISDLFGAIQSDISMSSSPQCDTGFSGSTAAIVCRLGSEVWVIWVGDSKCVGFAHRCQILNSINDNQPSVNYEFNNGLNNHSNNKQQQSEKAHAYISDYAGSVTSKSNSHVLVEFQQLFESSDHSPSRPDELIRINEAGGHVQEYPGPLPKPTSRLMPHGIAMSRAFGDTNAERFGLSHQLEAVKLQVGWSLTGASGAKTTEDAARSASSSPWVWAFVLASDGLWDTTCLHEFGLNVVAGTWFDAIRETCKLPKDIAADLLNIACINAFKDRKILENGYSDDTTALLIFLRA